MKKIYILTAVFALLTLSLNAQQLPEYQRFKADKNLNPTQVTQVQNGQLNLSSATASSNQGKSMRAPMKALNQGEYYLGPYTTDDFNTTGLGFGDQYNAAQSIDLNVVLNRSEFEDHIGDEIVGFRFALAGSGVVPVWSFGAFPCTFSETSISWDSNQYSWDLGSMYGDGYVKITSLDELTDDGEYLIVNEGSSRAFNGSLTTLNSNNNYISVNINNGVIEANSTVNASKFYIERVTYNNQTYFAISNTNGTYIGYTGTTDGAMSTGANLTTTYLNTITFNNGNAVISGYRTNNPRQLRYYNNRFRYYASTTGQNIQIYKRIGSDVVFLNGGQWYEYRLDEPVVFNVSDNMDKLMIGYIYYQPLSSNTTYNTTPIAYNPNSTGHDHYALMYANASSTSTPDYQQSWWGWNFPGDLAVQLIFKSKKTAAPAITYVVNDDNVVITATGDGTVTLTVGDQTATGTGTASVTVPRTDVNYDVTATATAQETGKEESDPTTQVVTIPYMETAAPVITYTVNGDNVVITATGDGTVTLTVDGQTATGNGTASVTLPRTSSTYNVTATATAQETGKHISETTTEQITVPFLQTEAPSITYSSDGESVTITATANEPDANAVVTLTVGNGEPVTGTGSVSVTVPCGVTSTTVTATATAKVDGKAQSETTTEQVPIPGGEGWLEMYGTYNNPNDLLSLQSLEVDEDGEHLEIMMIDQFLASTLNNEQPNGYTYIMKETVNNEEKSSNAVNIPVYKTSSTMQGLYTKAQVDDDIDMHLTANALNSEMDYNVHPDRNALYYSLYRGDLNAAYPTIDARHRVSQLQKYEEKVNNNVHYFFTETHTSNILPVYQEQIEEQTVERLDVDYVQGVYNNELSYVPVIWTFGLYTARGDGKNNSYGSDIKREKLGDVTVKIKGSKSGGNNVEDTGAGWEGLFKVGNEWYCIYTPIIDIDGIVPNDKTHNDGDVATYVPYMYRAWCLYPGARSFKHVAQTNSQGQTVQVLADDGELTIPYLLGTNQVEASHTQIGQAWQNGQPKLQWAFGVPVSEDPANVPIAVRFYYKKNVTDASPSTLRAGKRADGEVDENSEEYYIVQVEGTADELVTSINEFYAGKAVVGVTYVNSLGMQSDKPFDGLNIVVTRYSDGTTSTSKVMR